MFTTKYINLDNYVQKNQIPSKIDITHTSIFVEILKMNYYSVFMCDNCTRLLFCLVDIFEILIFEITVNGST